MRWQHKVAVQKTLSLVPGGERINYLLQRHVTKKLPTKDGQFFLDFDEAVKHVRCLERHATWPLEAVRAYEFGAGWHLIGPLSLWTLGISHQVVVDIDAHLRFGLVDHAVALLARHHTALEEWTGRALRRADPSPVTSLADLRERFGIDYRAPCDARCTDFPERTFHLISSTFTLEHIPREEIAAILRESRRLLANGGIVSCSIDMKDHYSYDDPTISAYNFLRYSDRRWRLVNSSLHHQNRLRARDYRELFAGADLPILEEVLRTPDAEEREQMRRLPLAPRFMRAYSADELEPLEMAVVASRA